ncbi:type-F conjugative transfer system protein TrbI [Klebsiella pneumoniae]|nr:type-F conjugative transfer system protein TrbI [Klebsiella pneumoniae]WKF89230.1 type-F conjugative transfer system protein TrbI [Klebsiella pneumoniae]
MKNNTEQPVSTTSHTFRRIPVIVALVLFALATSAFLSRMVLEYSTPRVVAFDMKKTLDSFMDSVSQKQLTEAQSKALSDRFNDALEKSLAEYQQQHHVVILVSPAAFEAQQAGFLAKAKDGWSCPDGVTRYMDVRYRDKAEVNKLSTEGK